MMRDGRKASGLFLALLAIVAQLTLAASVPAAAISLADVSTLCQHRDTPDTPAAPVHSSIDCLLCFFCHNTAGQVGLLAAPPVLPAPVTVRVARVVVLPPPTAPPLRIVSAARPRGPPIQV